MPLTGKYLKYSPEITLEIFTLIYNKLIENEWTSIDVMLLYNQFTTKWNYIIDYGRGKQFYSSVINRELKETTVQEILGYDPFVKDDFVLPDKWCIKTTKDKNGKLIGEWFDKQSRCRCYHDTCLGKYYNSYNLLNESIILEGNLAASFASSRIREEYTEITFDQFKKYVLKESIETPKEVIPKYVELLEGFDSTCTSKIFDTNQPIPQMSGWSNQWTWESIFKNDTQRSYFKPSTKEAFDAQNNPIEKWSVGSYVVFLKDYLQNNGRKKGDISKITKIRKDTIEFEDNIGNNIDGEFSVVTNLKWFATKAEAEEFAKTLVEPVKHGNGIINIIELREFPKEGYCKTDRIELRDYLKNKFPQYIQKSWQSKYTIVAWNETGYWWCEEKSSKPEYQLSQLEKFFIKEEVKQPLKQAVHCKTQEEWDFVLSKITHSFSDKAWNNYKSESCFIDASTISSKNRCINAGYQILSFQEWCDLNGYKMEKEVKFEVGKWYKLNNWISKFNYLEEDYKFYGENINTSTGFVDKFGWMDLNKYTPIEISIEEIQQYLPDNHPDKMESNQKFKDGDWIVYYIESKNSYIKSFKLNDIIQVINGKANNTVPFIGVTDITNCFRHATPEEIHNHLISIGKAQSEKYPFKKLEEDDLIWEIKTEDIRWTESVPITKDNWKHEMLLSVNDEEFPMVNIIKTNTIKQLLNND